MSEAVRKVGGEGLGGGGGGGAKIERGRGKIEEEEATFESIISAAWLFFSSA